MIIYSIQLRFLILFLCYTASRGQYTMSCPAGSLTYCTFHPIIIHYMFCNIQYLHLRAKTFSFHCHLKLQPPHLQALGSQVNVGVAFALFPVLPPHTDDADHCNYHHCSQHGQRRGKREGGLLAGGAAGLTAVSVVPPVISHGAPAGQRRKTEDQSSRQAGGL